MSDASNDRVPRVKGIAFRSVMTAFEAKRGADAVARAYTHMPDDLMRGLTYGEILAVGWYPVAWYRALFAALRAATGEGHELARWIGRDSLDADFHGVYRVFLMLLSPQTMISIGTRHFSQIYDTGRVSIVEKRAGHARVHWTGCAGFDRAMWTEILGSCERLIELAGGKNVRVALHAGGKDGDDRCDAGAFWT